MGGPMGRPIGGADKRADRGADKRAERPGAGPIEGTRAEVPTVDIGHYLTLFQISLTLIDTISS